MEGTEEAMEGTEEAMEETEVEGAMEETVMVVAAAMVETEVEAMAGTGVEAMVETGVVAAMAEIEAAMEAKWEEGEY